MVPLNQRPHRGVGLLALLCTLAVLSSASCGPSSTAATPTTTQESPSPTAPPASTDPAPTTTDAEVSDTTAPGTSPEEAAVLAAYQGYWDTYFEANAYPVNPNHPGIERYYTGIAKERFQGTLSDEVTMGMAVRLPDPSVSAHRPKVVELTATTAIVEDCSTDDSILYQPFRGDVLNDKVSTHLIRGTAVLIDGSWKFEDTVSLDGWEGVAGCAVE